MYVNHNKLSFCHKLTDCQTDNAITHKLVNISKQVTSTVQTRSQSASEDAFIFSVSLKSCHIKMPTVSNRACNVQNKCSSCDVMLQSFVIEDDSLTSPLIDNYQLSSTALLFFIYGKHN